MLGLPHMSQGPDWQGARVLLTGGSGFLGLHLARAVQGLGAQVTLLQRRASPAQGDLHQVLGDLRDGDFVRRAVQETAPHVVFHLAASRARSHTQGAFAETIDSNVTGTLNVLTACQDLPALRRIVVLGTGEEYGAGAVPFVETQREAPVSAYSLSKLAATHLAQMMAHNAGLPAVILRPSVAYGPAQGDDMFLPALIRALIAGRRFAMTAGAQTRDFIYIDDLVSALLLAGQSALPVGEVINIGAGQATQLGDMVAMIEAMIPAQGLVDRGAVPYRKGEAMAYHLSIEKAARLLHWVPRTPLAEGLARTIAWYRAHP